MYETPAVQFTGCGGTPTTALNRLRTVRNVLLRCATHTMSSTRALSKIATSRPTLGVLAIFKNEAQSMYEWLLHYEHEGVTQFVLLDQESSDNGAEIARQFGAEQPSRRVDVHLAPRRLEQNDHYNLYFHRLTTDWAIICDLDEFVYARREFVTIVDYLQSFHHQREVGVIGLPWKRFGSSGTMAQPVSAIAAFIRRYRSTDTNLEISKRMEIKCLFRVQAVPALAPRERSAVNATLRVYHQHRVARRPLYLPTSPPQLAGMRDHVKFVGPVSAQEFDSFGLHINHYQTGSCENYARVKMTRGSVISSQSTNMRTWAFLADFEAVSNRFVDEELKRKRGDDWATRLRSAVTTPTWPSLSYSSKYKNNLHLGNPLTWCASKVWPTGELVVPRMQREIKLCNATTLSQDLQRGYPVCPRPRGTVPSEKLERNDDLGAHEQLPRSEPMASAQTKIPLVGLPIVKSEVFPKKSRAWRTACTHGELAPGGWGASTVLVVAMHLEWRGGTVPSWISRQAPVFLYQRRNASKPCYAPNAGYESGIYLQFVIEHYGDLPAYAVFVQADWFARKTHAHPDRPFPLWQLQCLGNKSVGIGAAWRDWMPLGKRITIWPAYQLVRDADYFTRHSMFDHRRLGSRAGAAMEMCWKELASLFGKPVTSVGQPMELSFYPAQNFVVSRRRIQQYPLSTYERVYERLATHSNCFGQMKAGKQPYANYTFDLVEARLGTDNVKWRAKFAATAMEYMNHYLFGNQPIEHAPVAEVPSHTCETLPGLDVLPDSCVTSGHANSMPYPNCTDVMERRWVQTTERTLSADKYHRNIRVDSMPRLHALGANLTQYLLQFAQ